MTYDVSAFKWGLYYGSCSEALTWRESLGPDTGQSEAWRVCTNGAWLLWQWRKLPLAKREETWPAIQRAFDRITARAIRRGLQSLRGEKSPGATEWRQWARNWLTGTDRSRNAASVAAENAANFFDLTGRFHDPRFVVAAWSADTAMIAAMEDITPGHGDTTKFLTSISSSAGTAAWFAAIQIGVTTPRMAAENAEIAELHTQARDIRRELPEWPSG